MLVKQKELKKKDVIFCKETDTISDVFEQLKTSGFRCIICFILF